ncbi:type I polyketide synthase [Nocardia sp. NPDC048505]|uniref:type I polyketide synthase n=1 Tax=Nocardia sp. NPDC048505 TaxID=3155756 RepID=UPI0033D4B104
MANEEELRKYLKRAATELQTTRQRLQETVARANEPIAIVSMACRFPGGVASPEDLWDVVAQGRDLVSGWPTDRGWDSGAYDPDPEKEGTSYVRDGGFLYDAADFDAAFFGISPREAMAMDPQQRLLLESAWEVLERAGIDPATLRGTDTGVFAGLISTPYGPAITGDREGLGALLLTGRTSSVASGRIAYTLGLEGPAVTLDTACSSSLVAMHQAVQSLRTRESSLALAGGVCVFATTEAFVGFSAQRGLSADGRCKSYASAADGTSWGEGVGMVLLERLSDARRNGHPILAVIRGSAVNQDGASNGLVAPNGPAQQRVIRQALANAGVPAAEVDLVEGHGTGTALGDPIEAHALLSTYGAERRDGEPLWLGSIKSNMGHTQAAAGVAGVIKLVKAMEHGVMPPTLHVDEPSKHVDWTVGEVQLVTESRPWPRNGHPRRAAVSSFGISGTNAHLVVEQYTEPVAEPSETAEPEPDAMPVIPWLLSARSPEALLAQAERLSAHAHANPAVSPLDIGLSLSATRATFEHRAVILGRDRAELLDGVQALATGVSTDAVVRGVAGSVTKTTVLFPGQGAQRVGMGRELIAAYPVYAAAFDEVCAHFDGAFDTPLREVILAEPDSPEAELLDQTAYTQAALFTVEVALYRLTESWGLRTDYVIGHSIGEITAAYVAGVWSLADACKLVAARGRLMQSLPTGGAMVAVAAPVEQVRPLLAGRAGEVSIAAVNGPNAVVVSGVAEAVAEIVETLAAQGVRTKQLRVSHAFHSPLMDPILDEFRAVCDSLTPMTPTLGVISNLTGQLAETAELHSADYWVRHLREPVQFLAGAQWARRHGGAKVFVEVGPGAALSAMTQDCVADTDWDDITVVPVLRPQRDERTGFLTALATAHGAGAAVDWTAALTAAGGRRIALPTYPFQRKRYWLDCPLGGANVREAGLRASEHPLLGATVTPAQGGGLLLTGRLSRHTHAWLADHTISGSVLLPGTAFVELALHIGDLLDCPQVDELILQAPLILPAADGVEVQIVAGGAQESGERSVSIYSRPAAGTEDFGAESTWTCHAVGVIAPAADPAPADDLAPWPPAGAVAIPVTELYDNFAGIGYEYGPLFRGLRAAWSLGTEVFAEVALPAQSQSEAARFGLHPALLDAALHAMAFTGDPETAAAGEIRLPFAWEGVTLHAIGATTVRVRVTPDGADRIGLVLTDPSGRSVATVRALTVRAVAMDHLRGSAASTDESLFALGWVPVSRPEAAPAAGTWTAYTVAEEDSELAATSATLHLEHYEGGGRSAIVLRATAADGPPADVVRERVSEVLTRVQALLAGGTPSSPLVVLTRRAVAVHGAEDVEDLAAGAIWGMLRSAQNENPGRIMIVDVDDWAHYRDAVEVALAVDTEPQLAIRATALHAPRVGRAGVDTVGAADLVGTTDWALTALGSGALSGENMVLTPVETFGLGPDQVRVAVRATGMNFRDVLIVLGMYPDPNAPIGGEGSGVVLEVGSAVTEFAPGDRVMGLFAGVGSTVVTDRRTLVPMPAGWSFAQAAAVPAVFATAYYALVDLAKVQAGETLLIHAATGGVGMAAVQLARHLGVELLVTASTPKWRVLKAQGFDEDQIGNTRTTEFEAKFLATTDGRGVDVVLDSLAGEMVDASLRLLPRGGRFVEMGLTDLRDPDEVAAAHPGVWYRNFVLMEAGADRLHEIMLELVRLFEAGALTTLPVTTWDVRRAPEAFRFLGSARHIGKNVLMIPEAIDPEGTVLITGGTGSLGGLAARHLVTRYGARHLLLVSRRGAQADSAQELSEELTALGARVGFAACDVADPDALAAVLAGIDAEHRLTAVVHTAGVIDDALFIGQTPKHIEAVFRSKADAAWNLHEATRELDLSLFVLFSSVAGVFGSPGQANYAGANAFLDALAQHRHTLGLPATSLAWGLWERATGMTEHLTAQDRARIHREGFLPIPDEEGLALLDSALTLGQATAVPAKIDVATLRKNIDDLPATLRAVVRAGRRTADGGSVESSKLVASLIGKSETEQERLILEIIRAHGAAVLGHDSPEAVGVDQPFMDLGFDSLSAVEFRNRLKSSTGAKLPTTVVFDYPTPAALAGYLRQQIAPADDRPARIVAQIDALRGVCADVELDRSELDDITARLNELVRTLRGEEPDEVLASLDSADDDELFDFIDKPRSAAAYGAAGSL